MTESTVTDDGVVMVRRSVWPNGIIVTDFVAIGSSSPWPPTYNIIEARLNLPKKSDREFFRDHNIAY